MRYNLKKWILYVYFKLPEMLRDMIYIKYVRLVKGIYYKKYLLSSISEYSQKYLQTIYYVDGDTISHIYYHLKIGDNFEKEDCQGKEINIPKRYVAELQDISILSGCSFLISQKNRTCMDDIQYLYSDIQSIKNSDIISNSKHAMWIRQYEHEERIKKGIFLTGYGSTNYYHLTIEILSRLKYVDDLQMYSDWPLLIDEYVCDVPQYKELIETMNIFNHPIIYINKGVHYNVDCLIYPSANTWTPFCIKENKMLSSNDLKFSQEAFLNVRDRVLSTVSCRKAFRKIYVSRANASFRRLMNEDDIQKLFGVYGFEVVFPEKMSFQEQVKMFHEAKYVAGMSGAAMTNLIYCDEDTTYITFANDSNEMYFYPTIVRLLGMKCKILPAEFLDETGTVSNSTFIADIDACENYLKEYGD